MGQKVDFYAVLVALGHVAEVWAESWLCRAAGWRGRGQHFLKGGDDEVLALVNAHALDAAVLEGELLQAYAV